MHNLRTMYEFMIIGFVFGFITFISFHEFNLSLNDLTGYYIMPTNSTQNILKDCYYRDIDEMICFNLSDNDIFILSTISNVTIYKYDDFYVVKLILPKERILE